MKDIDFDEIGKRLYDLEADPPNDGWEKINPAVAPPNQTAKTGWRRHWWKPMIVVLPVLFFSVYKLNNNFTNDSALSASMNLQDAGIATEELVIPLGKDEEREQPVDETKSILTAPSEMHRNSPHTTSIGSTSKQKRGTPDSSSATTLENQNDYRDVGDFQSQLQSVLNKSGDMPDGNHLSREDLDMERLKSSMATTSPIAIEKPLVTAPVDTSHMQVIHTDKLVSEKTTGKVSAPQSADSKMENRKKGKAVTFQPDQKAAGALLPSDSSTRIDNREDQVVAIYVDSISADVKRKKQLDSWRITASYNPAYFRSSVSPIISDEVYITSVTNSKEFQKGNYGLAFGVGKTITSNLYLDAQLSFTKTSQAVNFSYATGNIDTLIAIELPDKTVQVKPVYEIASREISSNVSYGGIRLGVTYYFWTTQKSRFNVLVNSGVHFLMSSQVMEKQNGSWIEQSNERLNKVNYSLMLGAGYNLTLYPGWELMINPNITYFLKEVKFNNAPYNQSQQWLGINFMVSKTLGSGHRE